MDEVFSTQPNDSPSSHSDKSCRFGYIPILYHRRRAPTPVEDKAQKRGITANKKKAFDAIINTFLGFASAMDPNVIRLKMSSVVAFQVFHLIVS